MDGAQFFYRFCSPSADVGHRRVLPHPQPVIHHAADMLGKLTVDIFVDRTDFFGQHYVKIFHFFSLFYEVSDFGLVWGKIKCPNHALLRTLDLGAQVGSDPTDAEKP